MLPPRARNSLLAGAANGDSGWVTLLVSHRFSTVRMADLIVVLDGSRLAEVGSHQALLAKGGSYAELYEIQAEAYRGHAAEHEVRGEAGCVS